MNDCPKERRETGVTRQIRSLFRPGAPQREQRFGPSDHDRHAFDRLQGDPPTVGRLYDLTGDLNGYYGRIVFTPLHTSGMAAFDYGAMTYVRDAKRLREAPDDDLVVQINVAGGAVGEGGGASFDTGPGDAVLFDRTVPQSHRTAAVNQGFIILADRKALRSVAGSALHGLSARGGRGRLLMDYAAWLTGALPRARASDLVRTEEAVAAVLMASFTPEPVDGQLENTALGQVAVERAFAYIRAHTPNPISIAQIASAAFVSRATLYRLFQPLGGVAKQVWLARLEHARIWLNDPARPGALEAIAHGSGFATAAHFSRRFRDYYGFSPRNLRPF